MSISTYVGNTGRPWKFTLKYADGTVPPLQGLGNSNFTIRINTGSSTITGAGNWTVLDPVNGIVAYQPLASEVASAVSNGQTQITINPPAGSTTFPTDGLVITAVL